jgi:hypothetical protein
MTPTGIIIVIILLAVAYLTVDRAGSVSVVLLLAAGVVWGSLVGCLGGVDFLGGADHHDSDDYPDSDDYLSPDDYLGSDDEPEEFTCDDKLRNEYTRWSVVKKQLDIITEGLDRKRKYEASNILERWKLSSENFGVSTDKMKSEIREKRIGDPEAIVPRILAATPDDPPAGGVVIAGGTITYGNYTREISQARMRLLRQYGTPCEIATCAVRYSSIVSGGQQWNIPRSVYKLLVTKYGVTLEGFASPINSQTLPFRAEYPSIRFCSLFPDVDEPFGSVGSFFEANRVGITSTVNPPYVLDIMDKTAERVLSELARADAAGSPTRVFLTVPNWSDVEYYRSMMASKYLEKAMIHEPGKYYYEDSNNGDIPVKAYFASTFFILSTNCERNQNYEDIAEAFSL